MSDSVKAKLRRHQKILIGLGVAAVFILIGAAIPYFWHFGAGFAPEQETWGQFGDYMGGVLNPLFSLVALFALFFTITLQVRELDETREELHQTTLAARQQTFENTFFQMLSQLREISNSWQIAITKGSGSNREEHVYTGNKAKFEITWVWAQKARPPESLAEFPNESELLNEKARVLDAWNEYMRSQYGQLGHYFRTLYSILKYVDVTTLDLDKREYAEIVRSQVSADETYLLFYDSLLPQNEPCKLLLEKYRFFEFFNNAMGTQHEFVPIPNAHYRYYDKAAFGSNIPRAFDATLGGDQLPRE